jgi:hypothetical protein
VVKREVSSGAGRRGKSRIFGLIWVLSNSAVGEKKKEKAYLQATGVLVAGMGGGL